MIIPRRLHPAVAGFPARLSSALLALSLAAACGGEAGADGGGGKQSGTNAEADGCRIVQRTLPLPEEVKESSGAAWSRKAEGVFWTHNDSGGEPVLYAVGPDGQLKGVVPLEGAKMQDWEDMAIGPCEGGSCVYVADIGDNGRKKRDPVRMWVAPEPAPDGSGAAPPRRYEAVWPDGGRDAEAFFILPDGRMYLISKGNRETVDLYQWPTPLVEGAPVQLVRVRNLEPKPEQPGDRVTGAGASPNGSWVAVRTYSLLAIYRTADLLGNGRPAVRMDLTPLSEAQGEAVALADDGTVILTTEGQGHTIPGSSALLSCDLPR